MKTTKKKLPENIKPRTTRTPNKSEIRELHRKNSPAQHPLNKSESSKLWKLGVPEPFPITPQPKKRYKKPAQLAPNRIHQNSQVQPTPTPKSPSGRKPLADKKVVLRLYVRESHVEHWGGKENAQEICTTLLNMSRGDKATMAELLKEPQKKKQSMRHHTI